MARGKRKNDGVNNEARKRLRAIVVYKIKKNGAFAPFFLPHNELRHHISSGSL